MVIEFISGYYSEEGAVGQTECEIGSYAPNFSMAACAICPAGFYCDEKAMNFTRSCPAGQFCPEGSYQTYHCPPGTFSNKYGMNFICIYSALRQGFPLSRMTTNN